MHAKLNNEDYAKLLNRARPRWLPKEPVKKKLNLKQIFIIKNKYKKMK